jgi:toxin-antitoxin system PIN domain toxin
MTDLPDVNVLLALSIASHEFHGAGAVWLDETEAFATTPITEAGFVRLLLQPRLTGVELSPDDAVHALSLIKAQPHASFVPDTSPLDTSHFRYALTGPKQVTDLHLLDLAKARGWRLVTFDTKIEAALRPRDRRYVHVLE